MGGGKTLVKEHNGLKTYNILCDFICKADQPAALMQLVINTNIKLQLHSWKEPNLQVPFDPIVDYTGNVRIYWFYILVSCSTFTCTVPLTFFLLGQLSASLPRSGEGPWLRALASLCLWSGPYGGWRRQAVTLSVTSPEQPFGWYQLVVGGHSMNCAPSCSVSLYPSWFSLPARPQPLPSPLCPLGNCFCSPAPRTFGRTLCTSVHFSSLRHQISVALTCLWAFLLICQFLSSLLSSLAARVLLCI